MRPIFSLFLIATGLALAASALAGCDGSAQAPAPVPLPPPLEAGQCTPLGDGWRGPEPCPAYTCDDGEVSVDGQKTECRRATGALSWWVDVLPDGRRMVFRPEGTPLGDGIRETLCGDRWVLYSVVRAGERSACRCLDAESCPAGCTSARAPACCSPDDAAARREACGGPRPPGHDGIGAECVLDGEAGRCQPLLLDGALRPACCT